MFFSCIFQGDIDNSDFLETDIPAPHMLRIPPSHSYSEVRREEIRELVLEVRERGSSFLKLHDVCFSSGCFGQSFQNVKLLGSVFQAFLPQKMSLCSWFRLRSEGSLVCRCQTLKLFQHKLYTLESSRYGFTECANAHHTNSQGR